MNDSYVWLVPTLSALFLYGFAQGFVKMFISEVPPARYCLYFFFAKTAVNFGYWMHQGHPAVMAGSDPMLPWAGTAAYVLEGLGWICYYQSIASGPITIVGTLSAAYAAPTVIFAYLFLHEVLSPRQYVSVALVVLGCAGLSYAPPDPDAKVASKKWIPLALSALAFWGLWQTAVKYTYNNLGATDAKMAVFNIAGAFLTYGLYGFFFGRQGAGGKRELMESALPMAMMAGGDLGVIIATAIGPVSIVTPISGAYPLVTVAFASAVLKEPITPLQWVCLLLVLAGMFGLSIP